jgi:hypothetical protein
MSRRLVGSLLVLLVAGVFVVALTASSGGAASQPPDGARLDAYADVARRLYALEADGTGARAAVRRLAGEQVFATAARSRTPGALHRAALRELSAPGSQVARLSVSRAGQRLVDVGGRFVVAPATRTVPGSRGVVVRASDQDVAGYVALLHRLTGQAVVVRGSRGHVKAEPLDLLRVRMPVQAGAVEAGGRLYAARTITVPGWVTEQLHITVLVPTPKP